MFVSTKDSGAVYEYGIAISAARCRTTSIPSVAASTNRASRMSPSRMSIAARTAGSASSSQPAEPRELYRQKARTRAPSATRRSARWLPMNPSAPVTRTGTPSRAPGATSAALSGTGELLALPHVDPVVLDLERPHSLAAAQRALDECRHRAGHASGHPGQQLRLQRIDAAVDLAGDGRLLVDPGHQPVRAIHAAEGN